MCSRKGDKDDQLANVHAILEAYASKRLEWNGLVTYWWRGNQLCQPRRFDWDELEAIASHCEGKGGFWCEGITTPGPAPMKPSLVIPIDKGYHFYVWDHYFCSRCIDHLLTMANIVQCRFSSSRISLVGRARSLSRHWLCLHRPLRGRYPAVDGTVPAPLLQGPGCGLRHVDDIQRSEDGTHG